MKLVLKVILPIPTHTNCEYYVRVSSYYLQKLNLLTYRHIDRHITKDNSAIINSIQILVGNSKVALIVKKDTKYLNLLYEIK